MSTKPAAPPPAAVTAASAQHAESLLGRHLPEVRGFLALRCRDAELAEELTQEVAARVLAGTTALDPGRNVAGYLVRMAQNVWRDWLRHELVRRRAAGILEAQEKPAAPPADTALLDRELKAGLRRAIAALPAAQRQVVELRHQGQLTFQQIADRLGRPLGTVLTQMRTALQRMHQAMEAYR